MAFSLAEERCLAEQSISIQLSAEHFAYFPQSRTRCLQ